MSAPSQIDILLRLLPDNPSRVTDALTTSPQLATTADAHGYTLLHAAASYGHLDLLRTLVQQYSVDVNTGDEDGETALFYAERVEVIKCLFEELGADINVQNEEGKGVCERWEEDGEGDWVAEAIEYFHTKSSGNTGIANGTSAEAVEAPLVNTSAPIPDNLEINFGTMSELPNAELADPEIRRKIEELAQRGDLESEETQAELRALVTEVVTGMREDVVDGREAQRRRVED